MKFNMSKLDKELTEAKVPDSEPMPQTGCVICGSYEGEMPETAGHARWHVECGARRPDVVARVKARA